MAMALAFGPRCVDKLGGATIARIPRNQITIYSKAAETAFASREGSLHLEGAAGVRATTAAGDQPSAEHSGEATPNPAH